MRDPGEEARPQAMFCLVLSYTVSRSTNRSNDAQMSLKFGRGSSTKELFVLGSERPAIDFSFEGVVGRDKPSAGFQAAPAWPE